MLFGLWSELATNLLRGNKSTLWKQMSLPYNGKCVVGIINPFWCCYNFIYRLRAAGIVARFPPLYCNRRVWELDKRAHLVVSSSCISLSCISLSCKAIFLWACSNSSSWTSTESKTTVCSKCSNMHYKSNVDLWKFYRTFWDFFSNYYWHEWYRYICVSLGTRPSKNQKGGSGKSAGVEVYTVPGMQAHFRLPFD